METINNDDVIAIMTIMCVSYDDAVDLIKKGLNIEYVKTGLKNEINSGIETLQTEFKNTFDDIIKNE
jgi:hypothetical protein